MTPEDDPEPKSPDWFRTWGVGMIAVYVLRACIRVRGSYQFFFASGVVHQVLKSCSL